jgi:hypothetical protein
MMGQPVILADHPIWLALPAFGPAIVVAAVVVYVAVKNRRKSTAPDGDGGIGPSNDGTP